MLVDALHNQRNRKAAWLYLRSLPRGFRRHLIRMALNGTPIVVPGSHGPYGDDIA